MNITNESAKILIEASQNVKDSKDLLEKFSTNRSIEDPTRSILLAIYGTLVVIGTFGNSLVVISVARKKAMRTARNMFIVNLAVSDTFVCMVGTPLTLVELLTKYWPLPDWPIMCKATGAIQAICIFVSTISITAIALDRYQLIVYPTRSSLQTMSAVIVMFFIWLIAAVLASPLFIFRTLNTYKIGYIGVDTVAFCHEKWPIENGRALYSVLSLIFQYLLPASVVVGAHVQIHKRLRGRRRARKRTPAILVAIAVTYVISWLPLNVFNLVADYSEEPLMEPSTMIISYAVCHLFGMSSACSNPLLYGWLNDNFKKEFEEMLCFCKNGRFGSRQLGKKNSKRPAETEMTVLNPENTTSVNNKDSECSKMF